MKFLPVAQKLKWNTWGVDIESLSDLDTDKFPYVIIRTKATRMDTDARWSNLLPI